MKEIDQALVDGNFERLQFLLGQNEVDCKGLVLVHCKDKLIPEHFSEAELEAKGAILSLTQLRESTPAFVANFEQQMDYRDKTYVKRAYLGLQQIVNHWQTGQLANQDAQAQLNQEAVAQLKQVWLAGELPDTVKDGAAKRIENYIDHKYQQWENEALSGDEMRGLDKSIVEKLGNQWLLENMSPALVEKVNQNTVEQLLSYFHNKANVTAEFTGELQHFIVEAVIGQIHDDSINEQEEFRQLLKTEETRLLGGRVVADPMPIYQDAVQSLVEKWQNNRLAPNAWRTVNEYLFDQFKQFEIPGRLQHDFREKALEQLLEQYKADELDGTVKGDLQEKVEAFVKGHYETAVEKQTPFQDEVANVIFADILMTWQNEQNDDPAHEYFESLLTKDFRSQIGRLAMYVSQQAMVSEVHDLQQKVDALSSQVQQLLGTDVTQSMKASVSSSATDTADAADDADANGPRSKGKEAGFLSTFFPDRGNGAAAQVEGRASQVIPNASNGGGGS